MKLTQKGSGRPGTFLRGRLAASAPGRVRFDEPMRLHTTFRIGGPAEVWAEPQSAEQLHGLLEAARDGGLPVTVVGGGANLLVRDEGIPGLVVHLAARAFQQLEQVPGRGTAPGTEPESVPGTDFRSCDVPGTDVGFTGLVAGAGLPIEWLVRRAQEQGLSGVEFLAGVPGRVGGAVRMNAGTHDDEGKTHSVSDVVRWVSVMDLQGRVKRLRREEIPFRYRFSGLSDVIVLEAGLALTPDAPDAIAARVRRLRDFKERTQDWSAPSVGCIFKNPTSVPGTENGTRYLSAGQLIDEAGLKGRRAGGAEISTRHANFIMNTGNAAARDVLALIEEARASVLRRTGITLETEVQILPGHPELGRR